MTEKIAVFRGELDDAAVGSRRTSYFNLSVAFSTAPVMAVFRLLYRKITLNVLDVLTVSHTITVERHLHRIILRTKAVRQLAWDEQDKNVAAVAISYLGTLRRNAVLGMFALSLAFLLG